MIEAGGDLLVEEGSGPPGAPYLLLWGVASLIVSVLLIGLCAGSCTKSPEEKCEQQEKKSKRESSSKKSNLRVDIDLARDVEAVDLDVVTPQTNGSVSTGSAHTDRPKSHDRALPEIPGVNPSRTADDDDEDDNDGLYDVISKRPKRQPAQTNGTVQPKASPEAILGQNPYELVPGDGETEGGTTAVTTVTVPVAPAEDTTMPIYSMPNKGPRASQGSSPGAMRQSASSLASLRQGRGSSPIELARQAFFAESPPATSTGFGGFSPRNRTSNLEDGATNGTATNRRSHPYERVSEAGASPDERTRPSEYRDSESINTLNMSTSSAPPPPLPTKAPDLDLSDGQTSVAHNSLYGQVLTAPGAPGSAGASPVIGRAMQLVSNGSSAGGNGATAAGDTVSFVGSASGSGAAGPAKKEPPYHKVTVRESLASVRQREAEQARLRPPQDAMRPPPDALVLMSSGSDVDYDQINYDQIKSPGACGGTSGNAGGDTGSELYAEIGGAGSGTPSQRSSTYAAVGEGILGDHAPTPPPVDSLKQLKETLDPGYSQIGNVARARPHSTISTASSHGDGAPGESGMPVYAKVNKAKKPQKRQTLHGGEDLETMYAKVDKSRKSGAVAAAETGGTSEVTRVQGGARPKEINPLLRRPHGSSTSTAEPLRGAAGSADPGYSTIEGAIGPLKSTTTTTKKNDDYYEVVDEKAPPKSDLEAGSDYDPNYESMGSIARVSVPSAESGAPSSGVDREVVPVGGGAAIDGSNEQGMVHVSYNDQSKQSIFDRPGLIREHIYQEINEAKRNSKRKSSGSGKDQKKNGKHSRKDSSNGSKKS